jgi:NADPH2:quinone reductase
VRALVCTRLDGEDGLEPRADWPEPGPCGPTQVRVAVHAASVNFPDTLITRGRYQLRRDPPFVPGNEAGGVVMEVGTAVHGFAAGDRVLALTGVGAFADQVLVAPPVQQLHRIPDSMPFADAAAFNLTYGTAGHGLLERGGLRAGETVLINGAAGGCGSAAIQIAKAAGASVIAVAGGAAKTQLAAELGADWTIDHTELAGERGLSAAVRELTAERGVDVVFDNVGADVRDLVRCLAWNGRFLVVGFAGGDVPSLPLNLTVLKSIAVIGVAYGASAIADPAANRALFARLFQWYESGVLHPHIGARFPFEDGASAVRLLHERAALGKVVIHFTDEPTKEVTS